jgi:hypothetical protein
MKRRATYNALLEQSSKWIRNSALNPNKHMGKTVILLHWVVLRHRGEL